MRIFDVTRLIHHAVPVYEGDPEVSIEPWLSIARGSPVNVSRLSMGSHTGTHVDAPAHLREGAPGVDQLPLDVLIGPAPTPLPILWLVYREIIEVRLASSWR